MYPVDNIIHLLNNPGLAKQFKLGGDFFLSESGKSET